MKRVADPLAEKYAAVFQDFLAGAGERALREGLAQGRSEAIPKGSAARVKPPIHEEGFRPHRGVQRRRGRGGCAETRFRAFRNERRVP